MHNGMWIWYWNLCEGGNLDRIIARAKANDLHWIAPKLVSGSLNFDEPHQNQTLWKNPSIISSLQSEGIKVYGWGYHYGNYTSSDDWRTTSQWETDAVLRAFDLGIDGYIYDAEQEFEESVNPAEAAETMCRKVRERTEGSLLAYSPQAIPSYHRKFPYEIFEAYTDITMPMLYWKAFGMNVGSVIDWHLRDWQETFNKPISANEWMPIGQAYDGVNLSEVRQFQHKIKQHGAEGSSYWLWADEWPANTSVVLPKTRVEEASPPPPSQDIMMGAIATRALNRAVNALEIIGQTDNDNEWSREIAQQGQEDITTDARDVNRYFSGKA